MRFFGGDERWNDKAVGKVEGSGDNGLWFAGTAGRFAHDPDTLPSGEGRGVMSERGPRPGEETADAGDNEPPVKCAAVSDLTLEVRTGRLEPEEVPAN